MEKKGRWNYGNGPKQRETRRLGLRYVFFSLFLHILYTNYVLHTMLLFQTMQSHRLGLGMSLLFNS